MPIYLNNVAYDATELHLYFKTLKTLKTSKHATRTKNPRRFGPTRTVCGGRGVQSDGGIHVDDGIPVHVDQQHGDDGDDDADRRRRAAPARRSSPSRTSCSSRRGAGRRHTDWCAHRRPTVRRWYRYFIQVPYSRSHHHHHFFSKHSWQNATTTSNKCL